MDYSGIGIICDYKYLKGPNAGKSYRQRFETVGAFAVWARQYDSTGMVEILNTKVVDSEKVYWDDRWVAVKAN